MSVGTLRVAIAERASSLLGEALLFRGVTHHKKEWRTCPCSWCDKKREATAVISSVPFFYREPGVLVDDRRHIYRDMMRVRFRREMASLEQM